MGIAFGINSIWVTSPTMANFKRLFEMIPIAQNAWNSIFTTLMGTVTSLFFCALAGFAFAKYQFPGRNFLFYFVIATMLVPPEVGAVPLFIIMKKLNDFFWPLLYLRKQAKYTLMVTISMLPVSEGLSTPWPVILAGTTLVIIPIIMLYLVLQTFQKAGIMMGAVKG